MNKSKLLDYTLYGNPLSIITKYLDCKDINNLKNTNPKFNKRINFKNLQDVVQNKFETLLESLLGGHFNKFYELLKQCNATISGSIILQLLLNEQWADSDIDLYICGSKDKCNNSIIDFLTDTQLFKIKTFNSYNNMLPTKICQITEIYDFTFKNKMSYVNKIQIIKIGYDKETYDEHPDYNEDYIKLDYIKLDYIEPDAKLNQTIVDHYDFDVCKNMIYYDNNGFNLKINSLNNVFNKCISNINILDGGYMNSSFMRIIKYNHRGFTFDNHAIKCKILENYCIKYYKLLSVDFNDNNYTLVKNNDNGIITYSNGKTGIKLMKCHNNCLFGIFFKDQIKHYHVCDYLKGKPNPYVYCSDNITITEENSMIYINNNNNFLNFAEFKRLIQGNYPRRFTTSIDYNQYNIDKDLRIINSELLL